MPDLKLTNDFPDYTPEDWMALVTAGLRGAELESLTRQTDDGLVRGPLKTEADRPSDIAAISRTGAPLLGGRPWHITAHVRDPDIAFANQQMLEDLRGGASAVRVSLCEAGLPIDNKNDLKRLFDQVYTELIPIVIGPNSDPAKADLFAEMKDAHIYLGLAPKTDGLKDIAQAAPKTWRAVMINAARVYDTGGSEAQELAYLAASAAHSYRVLGPELAAKHICAELTTDQDGHLSIAKLRAARRIYARIAESFGQDGAELSLHAVTSTRMMQDIDPWTNMLRVMSAGFGAVVGGADFVTTRAFTHAIGTPTPFGQRIARNMQLMMMEESHLGQVKDAAFGSYFHEAMTEQLAQAAWTEFQQIEAEGGIDNIAPFKARIQAVKAAREAEAAPILGVTLHTADALREAPREAKVRRANP